MNVQEVKRECIGYWEYPPIAAYAPELAQTLPRSNTGGLKNVESLCCVVSIEPKRQGKTHPVQEVDQPSRIITLEVPYALHILFLIKCVEELVLKVG